MIKRVINSIKLYWVQSNSDRYCCYLRKKGIEIGTGTHICARTCRIDDTRPSLVMIGNNCYLNEHFTLLTHDFVTGVFLNTGLNFINSSGRVTIGNNVRFGQNVMVLKGVTIGDNCFIGAGSIVTKDIPSNSIAVGIPCKVIMSLEEYYNKRLQKCESEALDYARSIVERFGRKPETTDFWEEFHLFVSGDEVDTYPEIPIKKQLGAAYISYVANHKAKYSSFNEFLIAAGIDLE